MKRSWVPSPNWDNRAHGRVDAVVLHYTALAVDETIALFKSKDSGVSSHFVLDRDGSITQMVSIEHRAWHAGPSMLGSQRDVNDFSIGIELVNWGLLKKKGNLFYVWKADWTTAYDGPKPVQAGGDYWEPYTEGQYDTLVDLLIQLRAQYPGITRDRVKGHSQVCLPAGRKMDPGEAFDYKRVLTKVFV